MKRRPQYLLRVPGKRAPFQPPPCFHWEACKALAVVEKAGRSLCRKCADKIRAVEYPLRQPQEHLYGWAVQFDDEEKS